MPIDVEDQVAKYFAWLEGRVGHTLHADESTRRHEPLWLVDRDEVPVGPPPAEPDRRRRFVAMTLVAAALVACAVVVATRLDREQTPTNSPTPTPVDTAAPATTLGLATTSSLEPATTTTTPPAPATTIDPGEAVIAAAVASRACAAGPTAEAVAGLFTDAMIAARSIDIDVPVGGCIDAVPEPFTGSVPSCWATCAGAGRSFNRDALSVYEWFDATNTSTWSARLPVTYRVGGTFVDAIETWDVVPSADGFEIANYRIEDPFVDRAESMATLDEYLDDIESGNWLDAARLLDSGALSPEERPVIQELEPADFTLDGIAGALEAWCADGCDTTRPVDDEIVFDGGYELTRNGRTIRVGWYEGVYSIDGLPFRDDDSG